MIYLDNAATSWPKPSVVYESVNRFLKESAANPGRAGHRMSIEASRTVHAAREAVCDLLNAPDPLRVVFGHNITEALNLALFGILRSGDHVVTSSMEHNSVMRPLRALEKKGVSISVVACREDGCLIQEDVERVIQANTKLIVINHASNVTGTIQPIREIGKIARRRGILLLVDAAQTAGNYPIDVQQDGIDLLAFTGHKSLYGLTGTGGLVIGERVDVTAFEPLKHGGTGSHSEKEEQPLFLPDKYESGTVNAVGLAGLNAGIRWILERGVDEIRDYEMTLTSRLAEGLMSIPGLKVYGSQDLSSHGSIVAFNMNELESSEVALRLEDEADILCRSGLHCAPAAHHTIGTFPAGCVRFSLGMFNTVSDVDAAIHSVEGLCNKDGR